MTTTAAAPADRTFTITRRARNLGIGSTSQPVQRRMPNGSTRLEIESVDKPDVVGTLREVSAEYARVRRVNSGHDYNVAFFVDGVKVRRDEFVMAMEMLLTPGKAFHDASSHRRAPRWASDAETVTAV